MTEADPPHPAGDASPHRTAGQNLVAAFRAARIRQRPTLQAELRAERAALRQQRLSRLGRPKTQSEAPAPPQPAPEEHVPAPATESSIFAQIIDGAQAEAAPPPTAASPTAASPAAAPPAADPEPAEQPHSLPLSAIGFGPGMVIRFRQLGIETAADLAASDPAALRTALGDITRLINVDVWIATAQKACAA
jgi:hypothetical protein